MLVLYGDTNTELLEMYLALCDALARVPSSGITSVLQDWEYRSGTERLYLFIRGDTLRYDNITITWGGQSALDGGDYYPVNIKEIPAWLQQQ